MEVFKNALQALRQSFLDQRNPTERCQVEKRQTRYDYRSGPMKFLGQQLVKTMEDSGFPAFIHCHIRTPEEQNQVFFLGNSRAKAWGSPHQFGEAVDIVHPSFYWHVSPEYWETLQAAVGVVENKFSVKLIHGKRDWGWDSAHIQLADWKQFKAEIGNNRPTQTQLDQRFADVLPNVWKRFATNPKNDSKSLRFIVKRAP
tara:strand:- start:3334 stop:3933 length:600 start_codon:yes stop_codon:yes gene_type:complete